MTRELAEVVVVAVVVSASKLIPLLRRSGERIAVGCRVVCKPVVAEMLKDDSRLRMFMQI